MKALDIMKSDKEAQKTLWIHAALAGISLTYFFALFSAGNDIATNCLLKISTISFAISLATNSSITFVLKMTDIDGELAHFFQTTSPFGYIFILSQYSFALSIILLILYFNFYAGLLFIALIIFAIIAFFISFKKFQKYETELHLQRMKQIQQEDTHFSSESTKDQN